MLASLRALLDHSLDYAGLFPPAQLPLDEAIRNYALYRQQSQAWLLGHFVCPANRLAELKPYQADLFSAGPAFSFSVLGRGGSSFAEWLTGLQADLTDIAGFLQRQGTRVRVEAFEVRLPDDLRQATSQEIASRVSAAAGVVARRQLPPLALFYEAPRGADGRKLVPALVEGLTDACLKLRCGGPTPSAFPSSDQLAFTFQQAARRGRRLKFTAGLHHPLRQPAATGQPAMHGFVNVFLAGALAHAHPDLSIDVLRELLDDGSPEHFRIEDGSLGWRNYSVSTGQITTARKDFVLSFGSCSVEEPLADLQALGWL